MENTLTIFNFTQKEVRVAIIQKEPYFCMVDICSILELGNSRQVSKQLEQKYTHHFTKGVITNDTLTSGGTQKLSYINEFNLYRLIFQSRKKEAIKFQNWVLEEVIPQIRKTGKYELPAPQPPVQIKIAPTNSNYFTATELAKEFNINVVEFNNILCRENIQRKTRRGHYRIGLAYCHSGFAERHWLTKNNETFCTMVWTKKGREFLYNYFAKAQIQ